MADNEIELDGGTNKTEDEEITFDEFDIKSLAQIKTQFKDDKWEVDSPINYAGLIVLSEGTNWGFEDVDKIEDFVEHSYYVDGNGMYQMTKINPYGDDRVYSRSYGKKLFYIFINKSTNDKYIFSVTPFTLPSDTEGNYQSMYDKNSNSDFINIPSSNRYYYHSNLLKEFLFTSEDDKLIQWASKKWKGILGNDFINECNGYKIAKDNNFTLVIDKDGNQSIPYDSKIFNYITSVKFEEGITRLNHVTLPEGLKPINLPDTITEIGDLCLNDCPVSHFPSNLKKIGNNSLSISWSNPGVCILPEGLESIGNNSLDNICIVRYLYIPKSLKSVGEGSFKCYYSYNPLNKIFYEGDSLDTLKELCPNLFERMPNISEHVVLNAKPSDVPIHESLTEDVDNAISFDEYDPMEQARQGRDAFISKIKEEAKQCGAELINYTNMYPNRLDCEWENQIELKLNDVADGKYKAVLTADGERAICRNTEHVGDDDWILDEIDLDNNGIHSDNDLHSMLTYEYEDDLDKPWMKADDDSRCVVFEVDSIDNKNEYYMGYDYGWEDEYSMNDWTIEELVNAAKELLIEEHIIDKDGHLLGSEESDNDIHESIDNGIEFEEPDSQYVIGTEMSDNMKIYVHDILETSSSNPQKLDDIFNKNHVVLDFGVQSSFGIFYKVFGWDDDCALKTIVYMMSDEIDELIDIGLFKSN